MCNASNHSPDCTCGWGGDGHLGSGGGGGGYGGGGTPFLSGTAQISHLAREYGQSISFPTNCRYCGQEVYAYSNEFGSFVLFDELGWPWPKHDCHLAPAHVRQQAARDDYSEFYGWRMQEAADTFKLTLRRQPTPKGFQATVARTLGRMKFAGKQPFPEVIASFLSQLGSWRNHLVFPATCGQCRKPVHALHLTGGKTVYLDEVFTGHFHSCRDAGKNPPTMTFTEFREAVRGQNIPNAPRTVGARVQGLVVDVLGSEVRLLTAHGVIRNIRLGKPASVFDHLELTLPPPGGVAENVRRLVLLHSASGMRLPGTRLTIVARDG
jgi:hypothetical protein